MTFKLGSLGFSLPRSPSFYLFTGLLCSSRRGTSTRPSRALVDASKVETLDPERSRPFETRSRGQSRPCSVATRVTVMVVWGRRDSDHVEPLNVRVARRRRSATWEWCRMHSIYDPDSRLLPQCEASSRAIISLSVTRTLLWATIMRRSPGTCPFSVLGFLSLRPVDVLPIFKTLVVSSLSLLILVVYGSRIESRIELLRRHR